MARLVFAVWTSDELQADRSSSRLWTYLQSDAEKHELFHRNIENNSKMKNTSKKQKVFFALREFHVSVIFHCFFNNEARKN